MSGGIRQPTMNHAMTYLKVVEITLQYEKEKYQEFQQLLNSYFNDRQRQSTEEVIEKVKELFEDHIGLLFGFNVFLPHGFEINLPLEGGQPQNPPNLHDAVNFLGMIKMSHSAGGNIAVYYSFLDILALYRRGRKPIAEVHWEIVILFSDYIDLINEFDRFLPTTEPDPVMLLAELTRHQ